MGNRPPQPRSPATVEFEIRLKRHMDNAQAVAESASPRWAPPWPIPACRTTRTTTERFWEAKERMDEEVKIPRDCLDGFSRSTMHVHLMLMYRHGLIDDAGRVYRFALP